MLQCRCGDRGLNGQRAGLRELADRDRTAFPSQHRWRGNPTKSHRWPSASVPPPRSGRRTAAFEAATWRTARGVGGVRQRISNRSGKRLNWRFNRSSHQVLWWSKEHLRNHRRPGWSRYHLHAKYFQALWGASTTLKINWLRPQRTKINGARLPWGPENQTESVASTEMTLLDLLGKCLSVFTSHI